MQSSVSFVVLCFSAVVVDKLVAKSIISWILALIVGYKLFDLVASSRTRSSHHHQSTKVKREEADSSALVKKESISIESDLGSQTTSSTTTTTEEVLTISAESVPVGEDSYRNATTPEPSSDSTTSSSSTRHSQEDLLDELRKLQEDDRPFDAVHELQRLRANNLISEESKFSSESKRLIAKIDEANKEIFLLTDLLEKESIWKHRMKHKQCDIFASKVDPRDFKVVCDCPQSNLYNLISLIIETQYYKHWVPGVTQSTRWDHSKFYQNLYLRLTLPFPFKDREVLLKGYGDVWKGSKVMIYVGSIDSKEAEAKLGVKPGAVRADVVFSGILLKPLETGGAQITLIARLDLKMSIVPDALFDYAAKFVLAELCVFLRDRAKIMTAEPNNKLNKMWTERQTGSESQVYKEIQERLAKMTSDYK